MSVKENGPWEVYVFEDETDQTVYLQSDDFTHDVSLRVGGDFESHEQKVEYANEIARRLNAMNPKEPS